MTECKCKCEPNRVRVSVPHGRDQHPISCNGCGQQTYRPWYFTGTGGCSWRLCAACMAVVRRALKGQDLEVI